MELSELRDTLKVTQVDLAERMNVSQAVISKLEKKNRNIHIDQLRSMVSAMGGNLIIIANFEGRKVELSHIGKAGDSYVKMARRHKTYTKATGTCFAICLTSYWRECENRDDCADDCAKIGSTMEDDDRRALPDFSGIQIGASDRDAAFTRRGASLAFKRSR
jgi:plasmid maintenance system antidote protein VapI